MYINVGLKVWGYWSRVKGPGSCKDLQGLGKHGNLNGHGNGSCYLGAFI